MADEDIPADVRQFIIRSIDSVAQMEALVLFRQRQPEGLLTESWGLAWAWS